MADVREVSQVGVASDEIPCMAMQLVLGSCISVIRDCFDRP